MIREDEFKKWLANYYRPRTVSKVVTDFKSYARDPKIVKRADMMLDRHKDYIRACKLYEEFCAEHNYRSPVKAPELPSRAKRRKRTKVAVPSITDSEWNRLSAHLFPNGEPEAIVLRIMMSTGLRVADVLRIKPSAIAEALRREDHLVELELKGGYLQRMPAIGDDWDELVRLARKSDGGLHQTQNLAELITPDYPDPEANGPAYRRVRNLWQALCKKSRVQGTHKLHRIRFTVANRLISRGASLAEVQRLLGHFDIQTTQRYAHEFDLAKLTDLIRKNEE